MKEYDGREISKIWLGDDGETDAADDATDLIMRCSDSGECWVSVVNGGIELRRHNCKYLSSITWKE